MEEITKLKQQPGHDILMFGSATPVQSLLETDLIDEHGVLVHPIIVGSGKRAFKDGMATTKLKLVKTKTFSLGVALLCYEALVSPTPPRAQGGHATPSGHG